eukprot:gene5142-5508_t
MKWPVFLHTPNAFVGSGLKGLDQKMFNRMKKRIEEYCTSPALSLTKMKDIIDLFNETSAAGMDESINLVKPVIKYLRHKLLDSTAAVYLRLISLLDAMMRNCGIRAHVLIGRYKFLKTICYLSLSYKKKKDKVSHEAADFSYKCMEDWTTSLDERRDIFPYYAIFFEKMRPISFQFNQSSSTFTVTPLQLNRIEIDPAYRLESNLITPTPRSSPDMKSDNNPHEIKCDSESVVVSVVQSHPAIRPEQILAYQREGSVKSTPRHSHSSSLGLHAEFDAINSELAPSPEPSPEQLLPERKPIFIQSTPRGSDSSNLELHADSEALTSRDANEHDDDDDVLRVEHRVSPSQLEIKQAPYDANFKEDRKDMTASPTPTNRQLSGKMSEYLAAVNSSASKNLNDRRKSVNNESNIEIKFFGNQRVVIKKDVQA